MNSRERMLTALNNGRPDRLPCQVHGWIDYYLRTYLGGMDWYQAYERFGMDYAIYVSPTYRYSDRDLARWRPERRELGIDSSGNYHWEETITTPKGALHHAGSYNEITAWETEPLVKTEADFALWDAYLPLPVSADLTLIQEARDKLGDRGIVRSHPFSAGQGSPWQSFCILTGTQEAIMMAIDTPDFVHHALNSILQKTLKVTELWRGTSADMVETGGGAGSNTVISPKMFREFCLPYDRIQHAALHAVGVKIVYHLCGGLMHMLEMVAENRVALTGRIGSRQGAFPTVLVVEFEHLSELPIRGGIAPAADGIGIPKKSVGLAADNERHRNLRVVLEQLFIQPFVV